MGGYAFLGGVAEFRKAPNPPKKAKGIGGILSPLFKYTTEVPATKTAGEIQGILARHGATAVLIEFDKGEVVAISFKVKTASGELPFKLPVNADAVLGVLKRDAPLRYQNREHAVRVAWRIAKAWLEAQMAIVETEMVKMDEVFMPYMLYGKKTFYQLLSTGKLQLPPPQE